jgi:hypothetical protein
MRPIFFNIIFTVIIAMFVVIAFLINQNRELKKKIIPQQSSDNKNLSPEKRED